MARANKEASVSITAQNTFTDHIHPRDNEGGLLNLSISALTAGNVTVQRSYDGGTTWRDVKQYAVADAVNGFVDKVIEGGHEGREAYRVGIKTGDFVSGTIVCLITQ